MNDLIKGCVFGTQSGPELLAVVDGFADVDLKNEPFVAISIDAPPIRRITAPIIDSNGLRGIFVFGLLFLNWG